MDIENIAKSAKKASFRLSGLSCDKKNEALSKIAEVIVSSKKELLEANAKDMEQASSLLQAGEITQSIYNRLKLDEHKLRDVVQGFYDIIKLEDPIGKTLLATKIDNNLDLYKVSCPIGVIGVIFEARPDVVPQIASLAIKSGNAIILKGGKEATNTNLAFVKIIQDVLISLDFAENTVSYIESREDVQKLLTFDKYVDLIIPRGGNALVKYIKENTKIPVLGHADGICHIFIDESADFDMAKNIVIDSKTQYPSACNSVETILLHKNLSDDFVKNLIFALVQAQIEVRGDEKLMSITSCKQANEDDWSREYSDKILSIRYVDDIYCAIEHINNYGSGHTDCIITQDNNSCDIFMSLVDSAGVYHNASTRFADGFRYGFGAEVGISTNKTHARGPVGLEGLTIYKYKLFGNGQIVATYTGDGAKSFLHEKLIK